MLEGFEICSGNTETSSHLKFSSPKPPHFLHRKERQAVNSVEDPAGWGTCESVTKIVMLPGIPLPGLKEDDNGYRTIP